MSKELDKLAEEMRKLKPSKDARKSGMDAAMAAFDAEFAADQKESAGENNSMSAQGSATEPRLTSQNTRTGRVQSSGRRMMSRINNIFTFTPKTKMMMGSCAAALLAAFIVFPLMSDGILEPQISEKFEGISSEMDSAGEVSREEIVVTANRKKNDDRVATVPQPVAPVNEPVTTPTEQNGGISSVNELLQKVRKDSATQSSEDAGREAEFRTTQQQVGLTDSKRAPVARSPQADQNAREIRAIQLNQDNPRLFVDRETIVVAPPSRDKFENFERNPINLVTETPVSTFSIDVDTASYSFMRAAVNRGQLPPASSIRLEEMINYFPYDYTAPTSPEEPFKANVTVTPTPWNADTKLMHIGIKGYVPPAAEKPDSNIVLLIDTSGSMNAANKLPLLINSFKLLLNTLDEDDTVSIVTYAGSAGTVLEPTPASETGTIKAALNRLRSGGSTAGAAGLELAYQKAQENFDDEGVNRVILATDGDFNVGFSSPDDMKRFIEEKRDTGIFLSVLGFGMGNYNDHLMQSLAQNGNGVAAYIDSLAEANKVLADEAGSALFTIAKDVKIQVEFNPDTISEYRLIGYETRALKREDFNNDTVDAGEINAGHSVTVIYELTPVGSPAISVDNLRYVSKDVKPMTIGSDELAFVKIRHKLPNADKSTLQTFPIGPDQERNLRRAGNDTRFAVAVAAVGQKLRGDTQLADYSYDEAIKLASSAKGEDENGYRAEFIQLVRLMESMQEQAVDADGRRDRRR